MKELLGKRVIISGMELEIVSDDGEKWLCRNLTTKEMVSMKKSVLTQAVRLGKAEVVSER